MVQHELALGLSCPNMPAEGEALMAPAHFCRVSPFDLGRGHTHGAHVANHDQG
jgi:hypothetical protein